MQLMEEVAKTKFSKLANEKVLSPLDMKSSTFDLIRPDDPRAAMVTPGHLYDGKLVKGGWNLYPESAAAGLWTTPRDMARFVIGIIDSVKGRENSVLPQALAKQMLELQPNSNNYGLGPRIHSEISEFQHSGGTEGYVCYFVGFAETGQGAVIMTNSANGEKIISEIVNSLARVYEWPKGYNYSKLKRPTENIDTSIYKQYEGPFEISSVSAERKGGPSVKIDIIALDNKLFIQGPFPPPDGALKKFELTPESNTSFFNYEADLDVNFKDTNGFTINKFHAHRSIVVNEERNMTQNSSEEMKFPSSTADLSTKLGLDLKQVEQIQIESSLEIKNQTVPNEECIHLGEQKNNHSNDDSVDITDDEMAKSDFASSNTAKKYR